MIQDLEKVKSLKFDPSDLNLESGNQMKNKKVLPYY